MQKKHISKNLTRLTDMNSEQIKMMQKTLLDYSKIIKDTDKDLQSTSLSEWTRSKLVEMKVDSMKRSRQLRAKLVSYGIHRFGGMFVDYDCKWVHTEIGFVHYEC